MLETKFQNYIILNSISAGLAGTIMDTIIYPLDTIKIRLQSNFFKKKILKNPYRGFLPTIISSGPFFTCYFFIYENSKIFLSKKKTFEVF